MKEAKSENLFQKMFGKKHMKGNKPQNGENIVSGTIEQEITKPESELPKVPDNGENTIFIDGKPAK